MIIADPTTSPDTTPDAEPIGATGVLLLLHVPPVVASVSVAVELRHTPAAVLNVAGNAFTVCILVE